MNDYLVFRLNITFEKKALKLKNLGHVSVIMFRYETVVLELPKHSGIDLLISWMIHLLISLGKHLK